jgi:hypothetical protein
LPHPSRLLSINASQCHSGQGEQTPCHILQDSPVVEVQHQQTWPEDLDTKTNLWRMEADLRAKAQFITSTDIRMLMMLSKAKKKIQYLKEATTQCIWNSLP